MVRPRVLLILLLSVTSCSPTAPTARLDEDFILALAETARVGGTGVSILFAGVEGDSRCPADAICIQGGDAIVRIDVRSGARVRSYHLHTGDMQPVTHEGLVIALVNLTPYPFSSRTIRPEEYRATLRVTL